MQLGLIYRLYCFNFDTGMLFINVLLYCVEEVKRNYVFNTANSFALRGRIAHMSFIEKLEERMVLLYDINDDEAERHQEMPYPLCVKVLSCCNFTVCTFVII